MCLVLRQLFALCHLGRAELLLPLKPIRNSGANLTSKSPSVSFYISAKKKTHKWTSVSLHKIESPLRPKSKLSLTSNLQKLSLGQRLLKPSTGKRYVMSLQHKYVEEMIATDSVYPAFRGIFSSIVCLVLGSNQINLLIKWSSSSFHIWLHFNGAIHL